MVFFLARDAAGAETGRVRAAGEAIVGSVFDESENGALVAVWSAAWAVEAKGAIFAAQERKWQRDRFEKGLRQLIRMRAETQGEP